MGGRLITLETQEEYDDIRSYLISEYNYISKPHHSPKSVSLHKGAVIIYGWGPVDQGVVNISVQAYFFEEV